VARVTVLLLSGGLDSAVCAAMTHPDQALFVNYGQPHAGQERSAAERIATRFSIPLFKASVTLPFGSPTTDPAMLVPGRNLILLALAANVIAGAGPLHRAVIIGANADDDAGYPDCRLEFFMAAEPALGVEVITPLIAKTKPEIGLLAAQLDVPVSWTWSCYYPVDDEHPCGHCDACKHRAEALA
jgi:7-cyano-7-deazaguanine synthase